MPIFEDIFSKIKRKQKKKKEQATIFIDIHEKNSLVAAELVELGCKIEFKNLEVADYLISRSNIAIERKTVSDFISSMLNKRLIRQLQELRQYPFCLLLIEGIDEQELYNENENSGMHPNAIRGFLLSIMLEFQVPILFTKNYEDTARFLAVLARKKEKEHVSLRATKKIMSKEEQIQYILEGFQGIGPATAKKLLKKFKTLRNIFNASEEELRELIGKKSEIFKLLDNKQQKYL